MDFEGIPQLDCSSVECIKSDDGWLGTGLFGDVVRVGFHGIHGCIAAKCIHFGPENNDKEKLSHIIFNEAICLQKANHDSIVRFFGITQWPNGVAIVTQYMPSGNLNELLLNSAVELGALLRLRMSAEIADGLSYIHNFLKDASIVHGDLKPENILLSDDLHCKIGDFRSSVLFENEENICSRQSNRRSNLFFTPMYAAPELLRNPTFKRIPSIDTFSFGIVVYVVLKRKAPSTTQNCRMYLDDVKIGNRPQLVVESLCKEFEKCYQSITAVKALAKLVTQCWQQDATDRPSMKEVRDDLLELLASISSAVIHSQVTLASSNIKFKMLLRSQCECVTIDKLEDFTNCSNSENEETSLIPDHSKNHITDKSQIKSSITTKVKKHDSNAISDRSTANIEYDASNFLTSSNDVDVLGNGSFGVVRKCVHNRLGNVAVKCMHCGGTSSSLVEARNRVLLLSQFNHDNIVQTYGIVSWGRCFGIVMEEVKCGNLKDLLANKEVETIAWKLRHLMIFQLANALLYLHNPKKAYVHLDVKPENVLLTLDLKVKLADFGALAIAMATGAQQASSDISSKQYTPLYTAPERLKDLFCEPATPMDVYSFAMIIYEVVTRHEVFYDARANRHLLMNLIAARGQKPNTKCVDSVKVDLQKSADDMEIFLKLSYVMEHCWCFEPKERFSMNKVTEILTEFAGSDNPYALETKIQANIVAKALFQTRKKVPLNELFPPFQHSPSTSDGVAVSLRT